MAPKKLKNVPNIVLGILIPGSFRSEFFCENSFHFTSLFHYQLLPQV